MSISDFYTKEKANDGVKLELRYPDGTPSEHWIVVRGTDSDAFRRSSIQSQRKVNEMRKIDDEEERNKQLEEAARKEIAQLVVDWSFDKGEYYANLPDDEKAINDFTLENVMVALDKAPHLADEILNFATQRANYLEKKSRASTSGSKPKRN